MNSIELSATQVGLATLLILINAALSFGLRLGLERTLLWASFRTMTQLVVVGLVLEWVFEVNRWYVVLVLATCMTAIAALTAVQRAALRYRGILLDAFISLAGSSWFVTGFALLVVLHGPNRSFTQWYDPQYLIPLLGMVLGNALNGISLGLQTFTDALHHRRSEIETRLALGGTSWEASGPLVRDAVRTGMIPIINSMMIVGLVSLPGMMTGQLLAGAEPMNAIRYQIVIMFLIAAASAIGTVAVVLLAYRRLFSSLHQLNVNVLSKK